MVQIPLAPKIITRGLDELLQKDADSKRITVARSYHVQKS
jgi:hypothetical protein